MHLVQLGKLRHGGRQGPASITAPWAGQSGGPGSLPPSKALPPPTLAAGAPWCSLMIPHQQPQVKGPGPGERTSPLPFSPRRRCHYCGLSNFPEALWAPSPSSRPGLGPSAPPSRSWRWAPTLCLGPLIRNGWGAPGWGKERRGGEGEEGLGGGEGGFTTSEPSHLPSSRTASAWSWTSPASGLGEGTPHSPEPGQPPHRPSAGSGEEATWATEEGDSPADRPGEWSEHPS